MNLRIFALTALLPVNALLAQTLVMASDTTRWVYANFTQDNNAEKVAYNYEHYEAPPRPKSWKCIHKTPRDLGFSEGDTVSLYAILERIQKLGFEKMDGKGSNGHPFRVPGFVLYHGDPWQGNMYEAVEPITNQRGDKYILYNGMPPSEGSIQTISGVVEMAMPIERGDTLTVFPLDSHWFFWDPKPKK